LHLKFSCAMFWGVKGRAVRKYALGRVPKGGRKSWQNLQKA
jgi:hypothetical protein